MSKTHTGDVTSRAKKLSRWLVDRAKAAGAPCTRKEIDLRADSVCKGLEIEDRDAAIKAALVFFKRDDPVGYTRMITYAMDVK